MPDIQRYQRQRSIPGESREVNPGRSVVQNPANAGLEEKGMANLLTVLGTEADQYGDQLASDAKIIAIHKEKLRQQNNVNTELNVTNKYKDVARVFEAENMQLKGDKTYTNMETGAKFRDDWFAKATKGMTDKDLINKIKAGIYSDADGMLNRFAVHQAKERSEVTKGAINTMQSGVLKDAYDGKGSIEYNIKDFTTKIMAQYTAGSIGSVDAEKYILDGSKEIAKANLDGIVSKDPILAEEMIKQGKFNQYLDEKTIKEFDEKAKHLKKERELDAKTAITEAKNKVIETGLQAVEATEATLVDAHVNRKLTREMVLKTKPVDFNKLPSQVQNRWNSTAEKFTGYIIAHEKEVERLAKGEKKEADIKVYNQYLTRAMTEAGNDNIPPEAKLSHAEIDMVIASGELDKPGWGKNLHATLDKSIKRADPLHQQKITRAINVLKDAERNELFGEPGSPEAELEMNGAINIMNAWIEANPDKEPDDYIKKLLEPKALSRVQEILDYIPFVNPVNKPNAEDIKERTGAIIENLTDPTKENKEKITVRGTVDSILVDADKKEKVEGKKTEKKPISMQGYDAGKNTIKLSDGRTLPIKDGVVEIDGHKYKVNVNKQKAPIQAKEKPPEHKKVEPKKVEPTYDEPLSFGEEMKKMEAEKKKKASSKKKK